MGYKFEVSGFLRTDNGYQYIQSYAGNSLFKAIIKMIKLKKSGCGCIKLEWR